MKKVSRADFPTLAAFRAAAERLSCELAAIRAVAEIEAAAEGAFLPTGEPLLLFERHIFSRETGGRFDKVAPALSNPRAGGYGPVSVQHERLRQAVMLAPEEAKRSASWGLFQILGRNHKQAGHPTLQGFINAMYRSADAHLEAFVSFVLSDIRLGAALRDRDFRTFARLYNGRNYARNRYDTRMAQAYLRHSAV